MGTLSNITIINLDKRKLHLTSDQDSMPVVLSSGSSLAQDRGRMEARIEALTAEVSELKKECQVRLITSFHITHDDKANLACVAGFQR